MTQKSMQMSFWFWSEQCLSILNSSDLAPAEFEKKFVPPNLGKILNRQIKFPLILIKMSKFVDAKLNSRRNFFPKVAWRTSLPSRLGVKGDYVCCLIIRGRRGKPQRDFLWGELTPLDTMLRFSFENRSRARSGEMAKNRVRKRFIFHVVVPELYRFWWICCCCCCC